MTPETLRLKVVDPEMPVLLEAVVPLLSIHEIVGVGLPTTRQNRKVVSPSRTEASNLARMNSGGSVMKKKKEITWSQQCFKISRRSREIPKNGNITQFLVDTVAEAHKTS